MRELAQKRIRVAIQIRRLKWRREIQQHGSFPVGQAGAEPALRAVQPLEEAPSQRDQLGKRGSVVAEIFAVGGVGEGLDLCPVHAAGLIAAVQFERLLLRQGDANVDRHSGHLPGHPILIAF